MATNDFTPTGDSPRASDDSDGIKNAIAAAIEQHDAAEQDGNEGKDDKQPDAEGKETPPEVKEPKDDDKVPEQRGKKPLVDAKKTAELEGHKADDKQVKAEDGKKPDAKAEDKKADEGKQPEALEPPTSWAAKDKELFAKQTPEAKAFLLERHRSMEADYTRKTQDLASLRKDYEAVDVIFAPQRDRMKAANVTASQLIQGWYTMEAVLQSGDFQRQAQLIAGAAKSYKIDPTRLALSVMTLGGVEDPVTALAEALKTAPVAAQPIRLPPEIEAKLAKVDNLERFITQEQQQRADAEVARINTDLDKFKAAVDGKGQLLHPHYDELLDTMSQLVDRAVADKKPVPSIEQLYQEAIFANPAVRQKWLDSNSAAERSKTEAAQQSAREKAVAEARAKSEKARKAGSSVTGAAGAGQPLNGRDRKEGGNLRSAIAAAVEDQDPVVH